MRTSDVVQIPGPIEVGDTLVRSIAGIFSECALIGRRLYAEKINISVNDLMSLEAGKIPPSVEPYLADLRIEHLQSYISCNYTASFEGGLTIQTNDIEEFISNLNSEPNSPKALEFSFGRHSSLSFRVAIQTWSSPGRISIEGDKPDVAHVKSLVEKAFQNAIPANDILYKRWIALVTAAVVFVISQTLLTISIHRLSDKFGYSSPYDLISSTILSMFLGWAVASLAISLRKMFPRADFQYGVKYKKRAALRSTVAWLLAAIVIPILFLIISLLLA